MEKFKDVVLVAIGLLIVFLLIDAAGFSIRRDHGGRGHHERYIDSDRGRHYYR